MNTVSPEPVVRSTDRKPSLSDFYAIEAQFKATELEYNSLMLHLDHTCLGANSSTSECIKVQELNLQMQSHLVALAEILTQIGPVGDDYQKEIRSQQKIIGQYAIKLEKQNAELDAALAVSKQSGLSVSESQVTARQHRYEYAGWSMGTIILAVLIWRQLKRKS